MTSNSPASRSTAIRVGVTLRDQRLVGHERLDRVLCLRIGLGEALIPVVGGRVQADLALPFRLREYRQPRSAA